ncbi:MAG: mycofactocin biosynthesis FMN-dependent deaminase MftD [Solirubrobacteraceae bacterium]|nr:mycofactocin biosynthesis FMN-dependent deaminase MftD [Solirubrobacteraceae bacterium]
MASTKAWFESVAEARRRARKRLPSSVYGALVAGAEASTTLAGNVAAFERLGLVPRIATGLGAGRDLATTVMGQEIAFPVIVSPTGVQAVHPDGEVAVARAAAAAGIAAGLSSFASKPLDAVVAANPATFFQAYWMGSRDRIVQILEHARAGGAKGLILTLDWTFGHRRDDGSPEIPQRIDLRTAVRMAPQALRRPRWVRTWARAGGLPDLTVPNMAAPGGPAPGFFDAYGEWMTTPPPTWDDIAWMRRQWDGPFMVKGVAHPDDARAAVHAGATAISVSNHGGNNVDTTPATIRLLPGIVDAVGDEVEVLLDGGVRRGSDVVKAVALGARAVLVGRAPLWGLAAGGEAGVANVLEILRAGIDETLVGLGRASIGDLRRDDVVVPPGFVHGATAVVGSAA